MLDHISELTEESPYYREENTEGDEYFGDELDEMVEEQNSQIPRLTLFFDSTDDATGLEDEKEDETLFSGNEEGDSAITVPMYENDITAYTVFH